MLIDSILRGGCAGLLAGVLAGVFALFVAEPSIEGAIALEEAAAAAPAVQAPLMQADPESPTDVPRMAELGGTIGARGAGSHAHAAHAHDTDDGLPRATQKLGLVIGMALFGVALGALFGVVFAWSRGRLAGDAWTRTLKLGAVVIAVFVVLPALSYPANPPAVGDPETVNQRTLLFLAVWALGSAAAFGAWYTVHLLERRGASRPSAHSIVGLGAISLVAIVLAVLPEAAGAREFPADLLWSFRLSALATQVVLFGGIAIVNGWLASYGPTAERSAIA